MQFKEMIRQNKFSLVVSLVLFLRLYRTEIRKLETVKER